MSVPTSLGSLGVFLMIVAPGLLFEVGLARRLNYLRRPLPDRLFRFVAWSLLFNAALLPATLSAARSVPDGVESIDVREGLLLWGWGLALTAVPYALGSWASQRAGWLRTLLLGRDPAPLSWHLLWDDLRDIDTDVYVRVRLRGSGSWIAGLWSYTSDEPDDLLLSPRIACDPSSGELLVDRLTSLPTIIEWGTLVSVTDLDLIEVQS